MKQHDSPSLRVNTKITKGVEVPRFYNLKHDVYMVFRPKKDKQRFSAKLLSKKICERSSCQLIDGYRGVHVET